MRDGKKRWLISMLKTSGSKRDHLLNGNYSETRHLSKDLLNYELPFHEPIKSTSHFYNGKINYDLLVRFLRGKVDCDWNEVYSEILNRIPTKLLDYREMIFWFVADKVEFIEGKPWNKATQRFIWTSGEMETVHYDDLKFQEEQKEFYVNPITNKLIRIEQKSWKKLNKK